MPPEAVPQQPTAVLLAPERHEWAEVNYCWEAPALCHRPLYFEETNLERYGYSRLPLGGFQPVVSAAHFFLTVPTLPYQMVVYPCREPIYTLGEYRPGSCVPFRYERLPLRPAAGLVEAGLAVGLIMLIP